jgi:hypothetical protein
MSTITEERANSLLQVSPPPRVRPVPEIDDVGRVALALDEMRPGWADEVDVARLDLEVATRCVFGQVFGSWTMGKAKMSGALPGHVLLPPSRQGARGVLHCNEHLPRWREEIAARR